MDTRDSASIPEREGLPDGVKVLLEDAERGDPEAQYVLGVMYEFGENGVPEDMKIAVAWYEKAARQHHPHAEEALKECALTLGMEALNAGDIPGAVGYFAASAAMGDDVAQVMTGDLVLRHGKGHVPDHIRSARFWYELAAKQGNADALLRLGDLYRRGVGAPVDRKKAEELLRSAVEKGSDQAEEYLKQYF